MTKRITKRTKSNLYKRFAFPFIGDHDDKHIQYNSHLLSLYTDDQLIRLLDCNEPIITSEKDLLDYEKEHIKCAREAKQSKNKVFDLNYYIQLKNEDALRYFKKCVKSVLVNRPSYIREKKLDELLK